MVADGKASPGMQLEPYRTPGQLGDNKNRYFAVNTIDPNSGYVHWMTPQGSYGVRIERKGTQIMCRIYRLK
ncbi:MAG: hypothetical protein KKE86_05085 [Planctomycetes bacterium]|nr:hypothetical protein [Planctomycetota bacterium]MCG2684486.1 hypothetical protein [Planctomycetales bacterium]